MGGPPRRHGCRQRPVAAGTLLGAALLAAAGSCAWSTPLAGRAPAPTGGARCASAARAQAGFRPRARRRAFEDEDYVGVRWAEERWLWGVSVMDEASGRKLHCGYFDSPREAAKAHDCLQLALDQDFPEQRQERKWRRNLPRETIYQDEVDDLRRGYGEGGGRRDEGGREEG